MPHPMAYLPSLVSSSKLKKIGNKLYSVAVAVAAYFTFHLTTIVVA